MKNLLLNHIKTIEHNFTDNSNNLFGNVYLVRTQAGLKKSIIDYTGDIDIPNKTFEKILDYLEFDEIPDLKNIKYPLIIEFIPFYMGYHGTTTYMKEI